MCLLILTILIAIPNLPSCLGQVSVCRLDGENIIFMNSPMANGDMEYESDSNSDIGEQ